MRVYLPPRIHHPFLLSDNRHYTFYVWRRVYMLHPLVPYLLVPGYLACAWAWFLRAGEPLLFPSLSSTTSDMLTRRAGGEQTLLQTLVLPACVIPTLLPTPLLEPRYFLIPYILLRAQVTDVQGWALALEAVWYVLINAVTMYVFLFKEREGVGRFMW
jgi:alpha-1,2-glucosyltransferase